MEERKGRTGTDGDNLDGSTFVRIEVADKEKKSTDVLEDHGEGEDFRLFDDHVVRKNNTRKTAPNNRFAPLHKCTQNWQATNAMQMAMWSLLGI